MALNKQEQSVSPRQLTAVAEADAVPQALAVPVVLTVTWAEATWDTDNGAGVRGGGRGLEPAWIHKAGI